MRKLVGSIFLPGILLFMGALFHPVSAQQKDPANVEQIISRMQELLYENPAKPDSIEKIMNTMLPDGSWKSIDYQNTDVSDWQVIHHLSGYVLPMAVACQNPQSPLYHNQKLFKAIHQSLGFWLSHNFTSRNWWYEYIGIPNTLSDVLILMNNEISEDDVLLAFRQMIGSTIALTGQNRVWLAEVQLKIGLLSFGRGRINLLGSFDPPENRIRQASKVIQEEVPVASKEGIQPDWSFHQHGMQQQFGNYGLAFAGTQAQWAFILQGSPFQYSLENIVVLRNYFLKGISSVVWNGKMDINGLGRQLFPGSPSRIGNRVMEILKLMAKTDTAYAEAYQVCIDQINGKALPYQEASFAGNTYFWRSALMVNRTPGYYVSVRMSSKRIQSTETGNGENMMGLYLGDGATYLYQTNKEYEDIFPVWDWRRIPGTTADVQTKINAEKSQRWQGVPNKNNFVGGLSDGKYGVAAMWVDKNELQAHKSWFFTPDSYAALGAGIKEDKNAEVATIIEQNLLNGTITAGSKQGKTLLKPEQTYTAKTINWVHHNNTGYVFLNPENIHVSSKEQQGSWDSVYVAGSKDIQSKEVFNLWIDHGTHPQNEGYAYRVLPNTDVNTLAKIAAKPSIKILQNNTQAQAISYANKNLIQAVFYQAGQINTGKSNQLKVDAPCILMVQQIDKKIHLTIAVPPKLGKEVTLTITGHFTGENCIYMADSNLTKMLFKLPTGLQSGDGLTQTISAF